ncbi:MAG: polyprenol monophosphomannose synthase [Patescibacteria group bacterium]
MKTSIIIPTYNEQENINELCERIFKNNPADVRIIFVDDSSPDGTAEKILRCADEQKRATRDSSAPFASLAPVGMTNIDSIKLIRRSAKLGLGSAYIEGFKAALADKADFIMEMDADLSHAPEDIPRMIEAMKDADLVIGSRRVAGGKIIGWNARRHFTSSMATWFARLVLRLNTKDVTAGFRCYRREILEKIDLDKIKSNGYAFQEEMLFLVERLGARVKEIPVEFNDRARGKSKLSFKDIVEYFITMGRLFLK